MLAAHELISLMAMAKDIALTEVYTPKTKADIIIEIFNKLVKAVEDKKKPAYYPNYAPNNHQNAGQAWPGYAGHTQQALPKAYWDRVSPFGL